VSQCFNPLETLAIPFPLLWNLVLVPTHSQNKKRIPSLASHAWIEGESLGSDYCHSGRDELEDTSDGCKDRISQWLYRGGGVH
jgi:hypothetical protein